MIATDEHGVPVWRVLRARALAESWALRFELWERQAATRRFPWDPVARYCALTFPARRGDHVEHPGGESASRIAEQIGAHTETVRRWIAAGSLTEAQADRVATGLGLHPLLLWPDYYGPTVDEWGSVAS